MDSLHYFNSTKEDSAYVSERVEKNKSQEEIVYDLFLEFKKMTASEVLEKFPRKVPLTSIRRAISNILFSGKLIKTEESKIGIYGSPEKYYIITEIDKRQFDLFTQIIN